METRDGFEERLADQFGDMEEVEPLVYKQITDFIRAEKKLSRERAIDYVRMQPYTTYQDLLDILKQARSLDSS